MKRRTIFRVAGGAATGAALSALPLAGQQARACTRILWNTKGDQVIVGRTMDWPESTEPRLYVLPAGMERDGGRLGTHEVIKTNALRWRSKFGSLITGAYDLGAIDGVNERGVAGHLLYLNHTDYGARDASKPGLQAGLWLQYALDNASSVSEALKLLEPVQIVMVAAHGHKASLHLALEDRSGDSAIVEYVGGKRVIHHGRQYHVMTNDPPYDEQLALLKKMEAEHAFTDPTRDTKLPGNMNPIDRFQRAAFFSRFLPEPHSERAAVAAMFSILANVSVPFGAPYKDFGSYNTEYRSVADLTRMTYFFQLTTVPSVSWTRLAQLDFAPGAPVLGLNPDAVDLMGNVRDRYRKVAPPF